MSSFEDELKRLAPGVSQGCISILEAAYGTCSGFHAGMDVMARILRDGIIPKQIPAFGEPWASIYRDTLQQVQTKGLGIMDAYQTALMVPGRPTLALHDAVSFRMMALTNAARTGNGKSSDDYKAMLKMLGYDLRLNLCGQKIEVNGKAMTDFIESEIRVKMEDASFGGKQRILDAINMSASDSSYHPIREYLQKLKWDGKPHIAKLAGYFQAAHVNLWPVILRKWLIGAVDRVMTSAQNPMLVLDGPQGCGKSLFARWLCPLEEYFRESPIDPDNRDDKIAASETWIWEVGELGSTTRRQDRDALKGFLSTKVFTARAPYGHFNLQYDVMSSFIGTINDEAGFLNDPTGARRFWVIEIDGINWDYGKDLSQDGIWAEAYAAWKAGEDRELNKAENTEMDEIKKNYEVMSSVEEAIKACFFIDPTVPTFTSFRDIRSVLKDPNRGDLTAADLTDRKIADALKNIGLQRTVRSITLQKPGSQTKTTIKGYIGIWPK